jgi:hypothetical protein
METEMEKILTLLMMPTPLLVMPTPLLLIKTAMRRVVK